jgi:uncharacterized membrane protein HdeD (DUF308 family)
LLCVTDKNLGKDPRIVNIILGILAVVVSASINVMPGLALVMMLLLVSVGPLFHGIAGIISGIIRQRLSITKSKT